MQDLIKNPQFKADSSTQISLKIPTITSLKLNNNFGIKPTANSVTAIQLQNAAGTSVLNVDTTNERVGIGTTGPVSTLEVIGVAAFSSGTAAAPGIARVGDLDTGIFFGTNIIGFSNAGVETMRMDGVGNVAIGTTTTAGRVLGVAGYQPANVATTPGTAADDLLVMSGGIGGTCTIATTGIGGIGAAFRFTGGVGGVASSAATSSTGGKGGEITLAGGIGGAATAAGTTRVGGAGGAITETAGTGGAATAGTTGTGGVGGAITLTAGTGGAATTSTTTDGGAGGNLSLYAGRGGAGTSTDGAGGVIIFYTSLTNAAQVEEMRIGTTGVGLGGTGTPAYQLEVQTDSAGKPGIGGLWTVVSDKRLKDNIEPADLDRCYEIVKTVPLKHFKWRDEMYDTEQIPDRNSIGWIADDVQTVFPKSVNKKVFTKVDGTEIPDVLDLNGGEMNMALYGCVQKLMQMVEELQKVGG